MKRHLFLFALVALLTAKFGLAAQAQGKNGKAKSDKQWQGSVADLSLLKLTPKSGYFSDEMTFAKVWKAWNGEKKMPKVNFKKNIVCVATTRGSRLGLNPRVKDGDLKTIAFATSDLGPGFRFHMVAVSREGVKTVNGKPLK